MTHFTATYSPEDNKLRFSATSRLDKDLYDKAYKLGFRWAPKQECFVAPMWTTAREDFLLELAEEIEDEDKSLVERAEERADRFSGYEERRKEDAERAHESANQLTKRFEFGQPILVGEHSEKSARRDAERSHTLMRKAVKAWETSEYWQMRAEAARDHAHYKQLPAVRYRRIKKLESEHRRH